MRGDLQAERCGWLFKSHLQGAGALCLPHYRPHSLLMLLLLLLIMFSKTERIVLPAVDLSGRRLTRFAVGCPCCG